MRSNVFACIELPANFGQIAWDNLISKYEEALTDLPRELVNAVSVGLFRDRNPPNAEPLPSRPIKPNTSAGLRGAARVCAFLHDHLLYLKLLVAEIHNVQDILHRALGGFDTDEIDTYQIVGLVSSDISQLTPLGAYYLRAIIRMRMAQEDFQLVSNWVEQVFEAIGQVRRGTMAPVVAMSVNQMLELSTQAGAWESLYLEINLRFFELSSGFSERTLFYRDQQQRREFKRRQNSYGIRTHVVWC